MAVIIADSSNVNYTTGGLSVANGFYRCEAANLLYAGTRLALTTKRNLSITPANAGNAQGVVLWLESTNSSTTTVQTAAAAKDVTASLQQIMGTVTMTIATPCVVSFTAHGFLAGQEVEFTTTSALPTGIVATTKYYVIAAGLLANSFEISASVGGSAINTTGSQSGVHTLYATRASKNLTGNQIANSVGDLNANILTPTWIVPFVFTAPYAVTAVAATWRINVIEPGAGTNEWSLDTADGTILTHAFWCDNAVSYTNNTDQVVAKNIVTIDQNATLKGALFTGSATNSICAVACRSTTPTAGNSAMFVWQNPALATYTLNIDGLFILSAQAGFRCGTSAAPITAANMATINEIAATSGTATFTGFSPASGLLGGGGVAKSSLWFYGAIPTYETTTLTVQANTGQANLTVADAVDWVLNDTVFVGKCTVQGASDNTFYTVSSVAANVITLTGNIVNSNRAVGAYVIRMNGYGIKLTSVAHSTRTWGSFSNLNISGCQIQDWNLNITTSGSLSLCFDDLANRSLWTINHCSCRSTLTINVPLVATDIGELGLTMDNLNCARTAPIGGAAFFAAAIGTTGYSSGVFTMSNCRVLHPTTSVATAISVDTQAVASPIGIWSMTNCTWNGTASGATSQWITISGICTNFSNNAFWGNSVTAVGSVRFQTMISMAGSTNTFDNCGTAVGLNNATALVGIVATGWSFGTTTANTTDVLIGAGAYFDWEWAAPLTAINIDTTVLSFALAGSTMKLTDYGPLTNNDLQYLPLGRYQRCGTGLADTTVHTAGSGKFSLRMQPTNSTSVLNWPNLVSGRSIPTGNIQNKTMTLACWVNISVAAYYAGTYQLPRLNVKYDNASTTYVQAAQATGWQLLFVSFTPTTTYGQIEVWVTGATDATTTNAYFYVDDISVQYPAGVTLDLGGMDLNAHASPVWPPIATLANLGQVWDELTASHTAAGTFGYKVQHPPQAMILQ